MKKFTIMLVLVGVILCLVPVRVDAAVSFNQNGDTYLSNAEISLGRYGTIKTGDGQYVYTDQANGIKKWTFYLTVAEDTSSIYLGLVPNQLDIQSIEVGSDFMKVTEKEVDGVTNVLLTATTSGGVKANSRVLLFTVTTKDLADEDCVLAFSPLAINPCDVIEGNYYDDEGNIVSKAEYDKVCSDKTVTIPEDEENPQTGSVIPYVAIGGGMLAIAGVFLYSRKSNKMYKL